MRICEIMELLSAKPLTEDCDESLEVSCACASDMMSDVLAFPKEHMGLLTGLINPQVMRTADMLDIRLVIFVRGKQPGAETMSMARETGLTVLATPLTLNIASGVLYLHGLRDGTKG